MAVDVVFYKTTSLPNEVHKTLGTAVLTYSGAKFLEPYDERNPIIRIKGKINFDDCNYLKVTGNGDDKYYFIEGVVVKSPSISHIKCKLDVLKTYSSYIDDMECYVVRTKLGSYNNVGIGPLMNNVPVKPYKNTIAVAFTHQSGSDSITEGFITPNEGLQTQQNLGFYVLTAVADDATADHGAS